MGFVTLLQRTTHCDFVQPVNDTIGERSSTGELEVAHRAERFQVHLMREDLGVGIQCDPFGTETVIIVQ